MRPVKQVPDLRMTGPRVNYGMNRISRQRAAFSIVSARSQTVIPHEVCERLQLKPGDILRYRVTDDGILLDKATEAGDDPFAVFSEWASEADARAYDGL
jgi:antitoxin PrlF